VGGAGGGLFPMTQRVFPKGDPTCPKSAHAAKFVEISGWCGHPYTWVEGMRPLFGHLRDSVAQGYWAT